jgi:hypothetical protein
MIIRLKRVVGHQEGYTMARVNTDQIQFYFGDMMTQGGKLINVTTIAFADSSIQVLESPDHIDELIDFLTGE